MITRAVVIRIGLGLAATAAGLMGADYFNVGPDAVAPWLDQDCILIWFCW